MKNTTNKNLEKKIIRNNQEIKYRELDIYGIPKNSEYSKKEKERQKFINEDGEIIFEINTGVNPKEKILPNMDYQYSEMTREQKDLFEALDCPEDLYEKLEDGFCSKFLGMENDDEKDNKKDNTEKKDNSALNENEVKNEKIINEEKIVDLKIKKDEKKNVLENKKTEKEIENKPDILLKENLKILEEDVQTLEGDQIKRSDFLKIIEEDAKLLNVQINNKKDIKKEKADLLKKIQDRILNANPSELKNKDKEEEEMNPDAILKFQIMNRLPRKGEIILEEKVQTAKGGGTIIFRKIKKVKEIRKKKYDYEKEEEIIPNEEGDEEIKKVKKQKFDFEKIDADDFSLEMEDDQPLTQEEIEKLKNNYKKIKETEKGPKMAELVYFRKNKRKEIKKIEEKEIEKDEYIDGLKVIKRYNKFKKTPFLKEKDLILKKMAIVDENEKIDIEDRPLLKRLIDEECELAPEEKIIHENYYCMKIIKEDLDVVPVQIKKERKKFVKVEKEKIDLGFLKRDKKESKEEKKKRKEILKKLKEERKLKNRLKKEAFNEERKRAIKEKNCQKNGNPLVGISVHKLI